ncbi:MAG: hypothetical protein ACLP1W_12775, partial [Rhodomicrobium sp.]
GLCSRAALTYGAVRFVVRIGDTAPATKLRAQQAAAQVPIQSSQNLALIGRTGERWLRNSG